jgi:polysaccharide transporter, PST family
MVTGLILNKIIAMYVGPGGYAVIGQFQNVVAMITALASGALNVGVTKYTAEHHADTERQRALWKTAGTLTLVLSATASVILFANADYLAASLLHDRQIGGVFRWLAASLVFISLNALLLAILNGRKEIRRYVCASVAGSILSLALSYVLVRGWGLYGALVALSVNQACIFTITLFVCLRAVWFRIWDLWGTVDRDSAAKLGKFALMAVASVTAIPLSQMLVRHEIIQSFGLDHAGYWDASMKLSNIYFTLATTTLSLYLLPRLSELKSMEEVRREVWSGYRVILPATAAAALVFYLLRESIVMTVFTYSFMPMTELLGWQLLGDVIKMASWLLGYVLIARARTVQFIVMEIAFGFGLWVLTVFGIGLFGFKGVSIAYTATYTLYLATVFVLVVGWKPIFQSKAIAT